MLAAVLGSRLFFRTLRRLTAAIRAKDSQVQAYMQENLLNRIVVLTLIGAERVLSRLGMLQRDVRDNTVKRSNYNAVARTFMGLGFLSGYAAAFLWGVFGIRSGAVTYGMMTAFLQLVGQIQRPIAELAHHVPAFIHSLTSVERLMELEELPLEERGEPVQLEGAPEIAIEHLTFGYAGQAEPVFKDFSFTFKGGEMTAITGHTGIGKSTLIRLILALLRPQEGSIRIGIADADHHRRARYSGLHHPYRHRRHYRYRPDQRRQEREVGHRQTHRLGLGAHHSRHHRRFRTHLQINAAPRGLRP